MNKSKKTLLIVLCVILLAAAVSVLCIGLRVAPAVSHALHISELLQPMLDAQNQMMHIAVSAEINGKPMVVESDIFLITEENTDFVALERSGNKVFVSGNVLFLENGKAFKIGDTMPLRMESYEDLLPQIKTLFDVLKISAEETDSETVYSITVTGDQVDALLAAASLGEALPVEGIETLNLCLMERSGKLDTIHFSGDGELDGTQVALDVMLSDFRVLAYGDYPIPKAVKQSAATADPDALFSLSEDLYRLVLALAPFGDMEAIDGTLKLTVDCGMIQLDTEMKPSDLKTSSTGQIDPAQLQALPEMAGWLCMEGDISCTPNGDAYVYVLTLEQASMTELAQMILPELVPYSGNLTEGSVSIHLTDGTVSMMAVSLKGELPMLFARVPVSVNATFSFH